ncbi:MAG TPA: hypothetical protein VFN11_09545 [Ktedonobacterales bacterium]|nr:hypothetical protein [Ktedonobacterales bacterium]
METEACGECAHPAPDLEQTQAQRIEPERGDASAASRGLVDGPSV